jgi:hypothetical protein
MAHLVISDVPGMSREMVEGMTAQLAEPLKRSPGFIIHGNGPTPRGWQVVEFWNSREDSERWYEANVKPNLPPGMNPEMSHYEIENVIQP